jgi:alpha 1,3-mannosyltransferase
MGVVQDADKTGRKYPPGHESDITMCAPQLLHLGRDDRPMWFNGWLYTNKFAGDGRTIGQFEVFMEEPKEMQQPEAWQLGESNMCCLTNAATRDFTLDEMAWLNELIKIARLTDK